MPLYNSDSSRLQRVKNKGNQCQSSECSSTGQTQDPERDALQTNDLQSHRLTDAYNSWLYPLCQMNYINHCRSQTFSFQQILFVERMTNWIHNNMVLGKRTCFCVSRLCINWFSCCVNPLPRFGSKELDLAVNTDYTNLSTLQKITHIYSMMCNIYLCTAGDLSCIHFYSGSTSFKATWSNFLPIKLVI